MIQPVMPDPNHIDTEPREPASQTDACWRDELKSAIRSARLLCDALGLAAQELLAQIDATPDFPVLVPRSFVARMRHGDAQDPLLLQVLARSSEAAGVPGYVQDPLQEREIAAGGVLRKYARRALLVTTAACPVHCRYCFRRHFPYSEQLAARESWSAALEQLRDAPDVDEVILSGGDPLTLSSARLAELVVSLEAIESLTTLRIHTRFPVIVPSRVTPTLLRTLEATRLRTVVVIHANHANEIDDSNVKGSLLALSRSCDLLLNQSVLLRGVNDSVPALRDLSQALFRARVTPYYLHMLDRVAGSASFEIPLARALTLVQQLRAELPGYLVPKLVREEPGALSKTPLL